MELSRITSKAQATKARQHIAAVWARRDRSHVPGAGGSSSSSSIPSRPCLLDFFLRVDVGTVTPSTHPSTSSSSATARVVRDCFFAFFDEREADFEPGFSAAMLLLVGAVLPVSSVSSLKRG